MSTCITEPLKNIIIPLLRLNMHYQSTAKTTQHFAEAIHTLNTTVILTVLVDIMNKRLLCRENEMHAVSLDSRLGLSQCLGPTRTWIHIKISGRYLAFLPIF